MNKEEQECSLCGGNGVDLHGYQVGDNCYMFLCPSCDGELDGQIHSGPDQNIFNHY